MGRNGGAPRVLEEVLHANGADPRRQIQMEHALRVVVLLEEVRLEAWRGRPHELINIVGPIIIVSI